MLHDHFIVQSPAIAPQQLLLLFHGVGDNPISMGEIGRWFAPLFPDALIVSVGGPNPSAPAGGPGREWFSVSGVSEENRQSRIDEAMPAFIEQVKYWQRHSGVMPAATALIGFSQGAMMVLESIKAEPGLASRLLAFNGRFASLPHNVPGTVTLHLIHGDEDRIVEATHAVAAYERLLALGGDVTLNLIDGLGHAIDERSMQAALDHLRYTVPKHYFDEALSGKPGEDDVISML